MNIYQLPQVNETYNTVTHNRLTVGDSHGNTMKIIFSLFHLGFATFPENAEQNYARLAEIYQKNPEDLTKKDLTEFKNILQKMEINTDATLCLIGDILHDRGNNDYFTLLLLKQLKEKNAKVDIIFSNHDKRFLTLYLNHETYGRETVASRTTPANIANIANIFNLQKKSVIGLGKLINRGLINRSAVDDLIEECYLPQLKLIDYALDEKGDLTIYSHAPVDLRAIKFLAKQLDVPYVDNSTTTLALTIELINREFQTIKAQPEKLKQLLAIDNNADVYTPEAPINAIAWNKKITDLNRCDLRIGENTIKFTHGHNGDTQNSKEQDFVTNLDYHNELGHGQVPNNHHLNETNQQFRCEAYAENTQIRNQITNTAKEISQNYQAFNKSKKLANSKAIFSGILLGGALMGAGTVGLAGFNFPGVIAGAIAGAAVAGITYFLLSRVGIRQKKKALDHTIQDKFAFFADTLHTTEASDNEFFDDILFYEDLTNLGLK